MIILKDGVFIAVLPNALGMQIGSMYSPFRMLVEFEFKNNWRRAITHIIINIMNNDIPYIRVSTKFFKVIKKIDREWYKQNRIKSLG